MQHAVSQLATVSIVAILVIIATFGAYMATNVLQISNQNNTNPAVSVSSANSTLALTGNGSATANSTSLIITTQQSSVSNVTTSSSTTNIALACSDLQIPSFGFGNVVTDTSSPAVICLQLYYYGAPLTLNLSTALSIQAVQYIYNGSVGTPRSFDGSSNFSIMISQNQITIGGATNENEGLIVEYDLTANHGASGTYELGFFSSSPGLDHWLIAYEPEECGDYGQVVAGNGQPSYVSGSGCITYDTTYLSSSSAEVTTTSTSQVHSIPGVSYPLLNGNLYFRVVGVANSTQ